MLRFGLLGVDHGPPPVDLHRARGEERDGPRQEPVLDRVDPRRKASLVVAGQHRDRLLERDRPAVERLVDEMDRARR